MDAGRVYDTDVLTPTCEDIMSNHKTKGGYMLSRFAGVVGAAARSQNSERSEESRD